MIRRLREALEWWLGRYQARRSPVQRITCLHPSWSGCKFGKRWCLVCGYTIRC
jgi:hypothetical protein